MIAIVNMSILYNVGMVRVCCLCLCLIFVSFLKRERQTIEVKYLKVAKRLKKSKNRACRERKEKCKENSEAHARFTGKEGHLSS